MNPPDLQLQLECYLNLKQALGFQMHAAAGLLKDFVRFVEGRGDCGPITAQLVMEWVRSTSSRCGAAGQASRLSIARCGSLRPHTFKTFIGLLAGTGLRSSEAIRLTVADVKLDLDPPRVLIRQTKFRKSRVVPFHPTTTEMLRRYCEQRLRLGYDGLSDAFFVSEQGRMLSYAAARRTFGALTRRLGLRQTAERRAPTLHWLRHSFAVRRLLTWYQEGRDVKACLPTLSIYLGHVCPEHSYWYLTATPELLSAAAVSFQKYAEEGGQV